MTDPTTSGRTSFAELGIIEPIYQALAQAGITHPFPIQELAIPLALAGTDLIGQARTGTGKTLAFGISLLHRLELLAHSQGTSSGKPRALVITPTRELAIQVGRDLSLASSRLGTRILTIYGGTGYDDQLESLASGIDVAVGTPGRLLDLVHRGALDLSSIQILVLDEADEMLDLGFLPDIEKLLATMPHDRQTLLFSATMPPPIMALARASLNRPVNIRAEGHDAQATVPDITQFVYQAHELDKPELVSRILQSSRATKVMIFTRTKRSAQRILDELVHRGFAVAALHGDLNQSVREKALKRFRTGAITTLVATDVAARGIDISQVSHVINYECPDTDTTYVHRIGRTGRAGNTGVAITLVDWADLTRWKTIDRALQLGKPEPVETYSSSDHLYADLDIPEGTIGTIRDDESTPQAAEPRSRRSRKERESTAPRRRRRRRRAGVDITDG